MIPRQGRSTATAGARAVPGIAVNPEECDGTLLKRDVPSVKAKPIVGRKEHLLIGEPQVGGGSDQGGIGKKDRALLGEKCHGLSDTESGEETRTLCDLVWRRTIVGQGVRHQALQILDASPGARVGREKFRGRLAVLHPRSAGLDA